MKNDIFEVMEACIDGTLDQVDLQFEDNALSVSYLRCEGYPVSYEKGFPISGLEEFQEHEDITVSMQEPNSTETRS